MTSKTRPLTFTAVDELGFAAGRGLLDSAEMPSRYFPTQLGPVLELLHLAECGYLPAHLVNALLTSSAASPLIQAIRDHRERWVSPENRRMGFIRSLRKGPNRDSESTAFLIDAQRAARDVARLPGAAPGQLVAAIEELDSNIHEHSDAPETGVLAYRAARETFEFVVADLGIGILSSLKSCPLYSTLADHGVALESALKDGTSRFGAYGNRGHGFRPIFIGLVNLRSSLRFRSGDHALLMCETSPALTMAQLAQKPPIGGFFVSVACFAKKDP